MRRVLGSWDGVAKSVGFALYHAHQPWMIPRDILSELVHAFTGKQLRSNRSPTIMHSGQSGCLLFSVLGLMFGLA